MSAVDPAAGPDPFTVPGHDWERISPRLALLRRGGLAAATLLVLAGVVLLLVLDTERRTWWVLLALAVLLVAGWLWWLIGRQVAAWGWVERDLDLVVTRGRLWRRLDVVPYGRMQLVDVTAGPLQRAAGITTVRMHTASASSGAQLPGLPPEVARRLRDRLAERGEAQAAGL